MMEFKKSYILTTLIILSITQASALNTSLEVESLMSNLLENASLLFGTPEPTDLTFHKSDSSISFNDLSLYDYVDEIDGGKSRILSWHSSGNETTYLQIPANAVVSETALLLSFNRDFGEHIVSVQSSCYEKCWGCGEKRCSDSDTKSFKAGDGIYSYNVSSSCKGSGDYEINGRNACGRSLDFTTESLSFKSSCAGWSPCYGCPYFGGANCNIKGTSAINYRRLPASNLSLDISGNGIIDWNMPGEFDNHQMVTNFSTQLNTFLTSCTPNSEGYCMIPLTFHSDSPGQVKVSGINVGYRTEKELLYDVLSGHIHDRDCAAGSEYHCGHGKAVCRKTWVRSFDEPSFFYLDVSASAKPYRPSIKVTCTREDGSTETAETDAKVAIRRLFDECVKMRIMVDSSVTIRECRKGEIDCRSCDLDVYGNVYYSKPKDYLVFGSELVAGVKTNVSVVLRNSGSATSSFIVSLLVDGVPQEYKIMNLTAGESRDLVFDYTPTAGEHNISITANLLSDGVTVQELFTGNNIISRLVTVEGSVVESEPTDSAASFEDVLLSVAGQRTLAVGCSVDRQCWDGFHETIDECVDGVCTHYCEGRCFPGFDYFGEYTLNPTNLEEGDTVPVSTTVYNNGELDANNFLVTLEDNGRIIDYRMISLEDGENREVEFSWTASSGRHLLSAHIDPLPEPDGVIPEVNEDNNVVSAVFDVNSPSSRSVTDFSGLVAYWRLDEKSGNSVHDYSGNGNHGFVNGASWGEGISEHALNFDGDGDYVQVSDPGLLDNLSALTVCSWARMDGLSAADHPGCVLCEKNQLQFRYTSSGFLFGVYDSESNYSSIGVGNSLNREVWHYFCGVWDGISGSMEFYVDGQLKDNMGGVDGSLASTGHGLYLGRWHGGWYELNGSLDEVRVYSRALSSTEIKDLFGLYRSGPLVAAYYFDEGNGLVANDSSGNENHGFINGASWVDGISETALSFDGVDDYVDLGDYWGVEGIGELSLGAWVKPLGDGSSNDMRILSKSADIELVYRRGQQDFMCRLRNESLGQSKWVISSSGFGDNNWHQVYCVYNTSHIMLYVDGVLQDDVEPFSGRLYDGGSILAVGRRGSQDGYYFKGLIDEILIYDIAITPEVVRQQYNDYTTALIYHFSEGEGNKTFDSSLNNNTGTLYGPNWTEGISGYGLLFDGVDDYIAVNGLEYSSPLVMVYCLMELMIILL
ncbi:MAG: hypothetical protein B6U72_04680 [Candidatus Altiarchaeales archaeon ex4484_2]|nr:MAG: hypothetical protein B6U72_04680 [Candidatus Altiarchaeales archaeon ex4484_2]